LKTSETGNFADFINRMETIQGGNHRSKAQVLQLLYHDFLREKNYPKRYKLIESICKGGFRYPPKMYNYEIQGDILVPIAFLKLFDNLFFPTVFQFPYSSNYNFDSAPYSKTYLLAGIRIIQLLQAHKMHNQTSLNSIRKNTMATNKLFRILNILFNYENVIISKLLEEFAEYGFVRLFGNAIVIPENFENYQIECLPKMDSIYDSNRKGLINDIAYLNMCSMRTQVNKIVLQSNNQSPYFKSLSLDNEKIDILEWIETKILNTISMYRLIKKTNSIEEEKVLEYKLALPKDDQDLLTIDPLLNIVKEMREIILQQLQNVLYDLNDGQCDRIFKTLLFYEKDWCR
jgi:hypothetical protein